VALIKDLFWSGVVVVPGVFYENVLVESRGILKTSVELDDPMLPYSSTEDGQRVETSGLLRFSDYLKKTKALYQSLGDFFIYHDKQESLESLGERLLLILPQLFLGSLKDF
jgi:hypothetical protein